MSRHVGELAEEFKVVDLEVRGEGVDVAVELQVLVFI